MIKPYYKLEIKDKAGQLIKELSGESESFVMAWNKIVYLQMAQPASFTVKDTGGTDRALTPDSNSLACAQSASDDTWGIVVGSGSTAVDIEDYSLGTLIADGNGAGQLEYQAGSYIVTPTISGSDCYFEVQRTFINNSGDTVSFQEYGIYVRGDIGASPYKFLAIRDVLSSAVDIPDSSTLTVTYTIKVSA